MPRVIIPLSSGVREDVDPKVMPEGALKRVENLRLRRDGRLGVRYGYTALSLVGQDTTIVPYDLASFNGRLLAMASPAGYSTPNDLHEYVAQPQFAWRGTDSNSDTRLCPVTSVRDLGRVPLQTNTVSIVDVAAGGGLVAMVWQDSATTSSINIFDPETDASVVVGTLGSITAPRVVAVGSVFFILGISGTSIALFRYDPATDNGTAALTAAFATGDTILRFDATPNEAGTGFIVGLARNTPTVTLRLFNASGTATQTITGPTVTLDMLSVYQQTARAHLLAVEADGEVDLYTYELSGGTLENSTLDISAQNDTTDRQPGMCVGNDTADLLITYGSQDVSPPITNQVDMLRVTPTTHALITHRIWHGMILASKPALVPDGELICGIVLDSDTTAGNAAGAIGIAEGKPIEQIVWYNDSGIARLGSGSTLTHVAKDASTGKFYSGKLVSADVLGTGAPLVVEMVIGGGRRQTAVIDNQLYIAGGSPQIFDGRQLVEAGFQARPMIVSATPSNGAGALPVDTVILVCATYEWTDSQGRFHASEPSDVAEVTMGASDDTITVVITTPLSIRCNNNNEFYGGSCRVVVYRSMAAPDKQLLFAGGATVSPAGATTWGQTVTVTLTGSDSSIEANRVLYTQGASGARSGPNPFVAPLPCRYIWAGSDKLVTAGVPAPTQIQESRAAFPNEPITWAQNLGGRAAAPESVLGVAKLDERRVAFTANGIVEFTGDGLDLNGVGDLGTPRRLPSPGGLHGGVDGWRSLVETAVGVFFQMAADAIYLLPRGGGAPVFVGAPVRDTLEAFPVITSATYLKSDQLVCFTCNNAGATDSVVLVFDLDTTQWFVDTDSSALLAACEYEGRLVILRAGNTIELQNTTHPAATFISTLVETGDIYPFGQGGEGQIDELQFFGEFRGNCVLTPSLSFNGGKTYVALSAKNLATSGQSRDYVVGDPVTLKWGPNRMRGDRVRVKFECTALSGAASEGIVYNFAAIDFSPHGRSALRDTNQKG